MRKLLIQKVLGKSVHWGYLATSDYRIVTGKMFLHETQPCPASMRKERERMG